MTTKVLKSDNTDEFMQTSDKQFFGMNEKSEQEVNGQTFGSNYTDRSESEQEDHFFTVVQDLGWNDH